MTQEDVQAELDQNPFNPFRLHLVSGKTLDVNNSGEGWILRSALFIVRWRKDGSEFYNIVSLRNIERIERIKT